MQHEKLEKKQSQKAFKKHAAEYEKKAFLGNVLKMYPSLKNKIFLLSFPLNDQTYGHK